MIAAEFNLIRYVIRSRIGRYPSPATTKAYYTQIKVLASALSTTRMALRLGGWLKAIKFFLAEIIAYFKGKDRASLKEYFEAILELVGSFTDNWFYLCRIGTLKWTSQR